MSGYTNWSHKCSYNSLQFDQRIHNLSMLGVFYNYRLLCDIWPNLPYADICPNLIMLQSWIITLRYLRGTFYLNINLCNIFQITIWRICDTIMYFPIMQHEVMLYMCITNSFHITPYIKSLLTHLTCIYFKVANNHRQLYITWYKINCNYIATFTTAHCIGHEIDSIYMFVTAEKLRFLKINDKNPDNLSMYILKE